MLTDAELAEIEARAKVLLAEWDNPVLLPTIYPNTVLRLVAELRHLRQLLEAPPGPLEVKGGSLSELRLDVRLRHPDELIPNWGLKEGSEC